MKTKRCSKCGETKPVSEFFKDKTKKDGYRSGCKACHKAYFQSHRGKSVQAKHAKSKKRKASIEKFLTKIPPSVYQIKCLKNDYSYIGSSIMPLRRRREHWHYLKKGRHRNAGLQADYDRYGRDAFEFSVIEDCSHLSEPELRLREQEYINAGINLYNKFDAVKETK